MFGRRRSYNFFQYFRAKSLIALICSATARLLGNKLKGAPGLAFETWDPRNRSPWEHYTPLCHPERSRGTCGVACPASTADQSTALPFVIPSEAEGSAVQRNLSW